MLTPAATYIPNHTKKILNFGIYTHIHRYKYVCVILFNFTSYHRTGTSHSLIYTLDTLPPNVFILQIFYNPVISLRGNLYCLTLPSSTNKKRFRTSKELVIPFEMHHTLF